MIIVCVDIQLNPLTGATNSSLDSILELANVKEIPIVFSCTRRELGAALYGRFTQIQPKMAVLSVLNVMGFETVDLLGISGAAKLSRSETKRI